MLLSVALCLITFGCTSDERLLAPGQDPVRRMIRPVVSALQAPPGSLIAVGVEVAPEAGVTLGSLQGTLSFDPSRLSYLGQAGYDSVTFPLVVVNASRASAGELRIISVDPRGLSAQPVVLAFEIKGSGYTDRLRYTTEQAISTSLTVVAEEAAGGQPRLDANLSIPSSPVQVGPAEWDRLAARIASRLIDSVPAGRRYSDVDGNGVINGIDALRLSSWSVGQQSPAGTPVPAPGDLSELAGNVGPSNLPGLGEASDTKGPGWNASCVRVWDGLDVLAAANEANQTDVPVAGDLIPADAVDTLTKLPRRGSACVNDPPGEWVPSNDSSFTVALDPARQVLIERRKFTVGFPEATSSASIDGFLTRWRATILGTLPSLNTIKGFVMQFPDPGPSVASVEALIIQLRADPLVAYAGRLDFRNRVEVRGRYPVDGALTPTRSEWFSTSNRSLIAWQAIRAPEAWSCENGLYGTAVPAVAVLDHSLASIGDFRLPPRIVANFSLKPDSIYSGSSSVGLNRRSHGLAVAGILAAEGDNGRGFTGLMWEAALAFYPMGKDSSTTNALQWWFDNFAGPDLAAGGAHLLVTSTSVGYSHDSVSVVGYRRFVETWLQSDSRNLFVYAAGQGVGTGLRRTLTQVASSRDSVVTASDRAVAELLSVYPGQIIVVGGSRPGSHSYWSPSNHWTGGVQIVAPAESVAVLANPVDFPPGGLRLAAGTSYAAPMVAGVAAQLQSMDPMLTAAQVKDFILRGAQALRIDLATGVHAPPPPVSGAPEPLYQLDAYGALTLLSAERAGTPICGYPVTAELDFAGAGVPTLRLEPPGRVGPSYSIPFVNEQFIRRLSVAQGGRRIAISSVNTAQSGFTSTETIVMNHLGQVIHSLSGVELSYLERDTADISTVSSTDPSVTISGPGRPSGGDVFHPLAGFAFGQGSFGIAALEISPAADRVAYGGYGTVFSFCPTEGITFPHNEVQWKTGPIQGGTGTMVYQATDVVCGYPRFAGGEIRWNHSGQEAIFALRTSSNNSPTGYSTSLRTWNASGGATALLSGEYAVGPWYASDDSLVTTYQSSQYPATSCTASMRRRSPTGFGNAIGSARSVPTRLCESFYAQSEQSSIGQGTWSTRQTPFGINPRKRIRVRSN